LARAIKADATHDAKMLPHQLLLLLLWRRRVSIWMHPAAAVFS